MPGVGVDNRNRVLVEQDGDNTSSVIQAGTANGAEVHQAGGAGNNSTINQGGSLNSIGDGVDDNASAGVTQFGNNNDSSIDQDPATRAVASVRQIGEANISGIRQETAAGASAADCVVCERFADGSSATSRRSTS